MLSQSADSGFDTTSYPNASISAAVSPQFHSVSSGNLGSYLAYPSHTGGAAAALKPPPAPAPAPSTTSGWSSVPRGNLDNYFSSGAAQATGVTVGPAPTIDAVSASAAVIGELRQAIAARASAAQIGKMDQITAAKLNREDELKIRAEQVALNERLKAVENGTAGPSVAELQYQQTAEQAQRQQLGYVSARAGGGNYGLAMREAAMNQAGIQAQANQGAAILRAQEVATARAQMIQLQDQIRSNDIIVAKTEADYKQQANMFNAEQVNMAKIKQAELNTQVNMLNAQLETQASMYNAGQYNAGQIAQAQLETQTNISNAQLSTQVAMQNAANTLAVQQQQAALNQQLGISNAQLENDMNRTKMDINSLNERFQQEQTRIRQQADADRAQREKESMRAANVSIINSGGGLPGGGGAAPQARVVTPTDTGTGQYKSIPDFLEPTAAAGEKRGQVVGPILGAYYGGPIGSMIGGVLGGPVGKYTGKVNEKVLDFFGIGRDEAKERDLNNRLAAEAAEKARLDELRKRLVAIGANPAEYGL
jgi:hypothetical protein